MCRLLKQERGLPKIETIIRVAATLKLPLKEMLNEMGYLSPPNEQLPKNLQEFIESDLRPTDITNEEIEVLASFSYYEGKAIKPERYARLLEEHRQRPLSRIIRVLEDQPPEIQEECAKMVETYVSSHGDGVLEE